MLNREQRWVVSGYVLSVRSLALDFLMAPYSSSFHCLTYQKLLYPPLALELDSRASSFGSEWNESPVCRSSKLPQNRCSSLDLWLGAGSHHQRVAVSVDDHKMSLKIQNVAGQYIGERNIWDYVCAKTCNNNRVWFKKILLNRLNITKIIHLLKA